MSIEKLTNVAVETRWPSLEQEARITLEFTSNAKFSIIIREGITKRQAAMLLVKVAGILVDEAILDEARL